MLLSLDCKPLCNKENHFSLMHKIRHGPPHLFREKNNVTSTSSISMMDKKTEEITVTFKDIISFDSKHQDVISVR